MLSYSVCFYVITSWSQGVLDLCTDFSCILTNFCEYFEFKLGKLRIEVTIVVVPCML